MLLPCLCLCLGTFLINMEFQLPSVEGTTDILNEMIEHHVIVLFASGFTALVVTTMFYLSCVCCSNNPEASSVDLDEISRSLKRIESQLSAARQLEIDEAILTCYYTKLGKKFHSSTECTMLRGREFNFINLPLEVDNWLAERIPTIYCAKCFYS